MGFFFLLELLRNRTDSHQLVMTKGVFWEWTEAFGFFYALTLRVYFSLFKKWFQIYRKAASQIQIIPVFIFLIYEDSLTWNTFPCERSLPLDWLIFTSLHQYVWALGRMKTLPSVRQGLGPVTSSHEPLSLTADWNQCIFSSGTLWGVDITRVWQVSGADTWLSAGLVNPSQQTRYRQTSPHGTGHLVEAQGWELRF